MAKKQKVKRKSNVIRTRNNGAFTEAMFWAFIRAALRGKSRWWKPITQCKINNRRVYKGPLKRQKYEYQCNYCKKWFPEKKISIDHVLPVGSLNCKEDLPGFVERLFCEVEGLQPLCDDCHNEKTKKEKNENRN